MPFATGPWHTPPRLPDDPELLCLVVLSHPERGRSLHAMRYVRHEWWFQEGTALSRSRRVLRWAYITDSIERMSELPPVDPLPPESRLLARGRITDHENVRLLTAFIAELKREQEALQAQVQQLLAERGGTDHDLVREVKRLRGLLKHEQDIRASQLAAHVRQRQEQGARVQQLEAELRRLRAGAG